MLTLDHSFLANGTLEADSDSLAPGGTRAVREDTSGVNSRNHKIHLDLRNVKGGQYTFRFSGSRTTNVSDRLHGSNVYVLNVDTVVRLSGPSGR
jgi:hypothetical protein